MTYKPWPTADQQHDAQGREDVVGNFVLNPATGQPYDSNAPMPVSASVTPAANQRVNAQSGDFVAGSLVDLATLLTLAGTPTDANTVASLMGRLTKIRDLLNSVAYDNTNALKTSLYGKGTIAGDTPFLLDTVIAGAMPHEQLTQYYILQGKGYSVSTGKQTNGAGGNFPLEFFNNSVNKTFLIYSITASSVGSAAAAQINTITTDAGWTGNTTPTLLNMKPGGSASGISTVVYNTTSQTVGAASTLVHTATQAANTTVELLSNNGFYLLPPSAANGIVVWAIPTAASSWAISLKWIEFP